MQSSTLQNVITHLRKLTDPARGKDLNDADLLERFCVRREEAAFALLVQRHGPMVHAICRRILGDVHEAEDAFQATFLVLVRKAGTIRKRQSLASWLHGVALRIARKTRARSIRQRTREREVLPPSAAIDPLDTLAAQELRAALDEEIERLPAKYRTPIILCYLAEKTHEQAAGELGWPKSSVTARLARARQLLQQRLTRRGFTIPAGLLAALLTEPAASAALPALLTLSTVRLAVQTVHGETIAVTTSTVLADGFVKGAALGKWTAALTLLTTIGFVAAVGHRLSAKREGPAPKAQAVGERRSPKDEVRKPRVDRLGDPLPDGVVARMGSSRMRHGGTRSLAFSPDGKTIVSAALSGLIMWDATTGKLLRRFDTTQINWSTSFVFTPEGIAIANAVLNKPSNEGIVTVQVFNPATGQLRRSVRIKESTSVANPTFSPDGKHLAFTHNNTVSLYDTKTGETVFRIPVRGFFAWSIAFAPDGKTLAFTDRTDTIHIHDAASGELVRELKHAGDVASIIRFSPNGRFLLSLPENRKPAKGEVGIWDLHDGKEIHRLNHPAPIAISAAFSPDSKRVAVGGGRWCLVLWEVESGKEVRRLSPHDGGIYGIAFSPDGKTLAAASPQGPIRLWDAATGKLLPASADTDMQSVRRLHFSADGKRLLGCAAAGIVWDPTNGLELRRFSDPGPINFKSANDTRYLALSPDESLLAAANRGGTISLWDAATGKERRVLKGHDRFVYDIVFAPNGRQLISNGSDEWIRVWDVASGRELHRLRGRTPLAVSTDSRWLATGDGTTSDIFVYDLASGREIKRFALQEQRQASRLAFSPDSRSLAVVGYVRGRDPTGVVKVWEVASGNLLRSLDDQKGLITSVAFSSDGRTLATGDQNGSLFLWELASGRRRHSFEGHESAINPLAFSPDGRTLAASSVDAPVYVWDVAGVIEQRHRPLSKDGLQRCWTDLADNDAPAAFQAIRRLRAVPAQTLSFVREHLKPMPAPDLKRVRQLVKALDSDVFAERQKAAAELEKHTDAAASLLRQIVAKDKPSLYVRRTLQQILEALETAPETLRAVRAVETLEAIATPDAVRLVGELAKGTTDARLTREAIATRERLKR